MTSSTAPHLVTVRQALEKRLAYRSGEDPMSGGIWVKARGEFWLQGKDGKEIYYKMGDIVDLIMPKEAL